MPVLATIASGPARRATCVMADDAIASDPADRLSALGWQLMLEDPMPDPQVQVARDDQLLHSVAIDGGPPIVRVWRSRQCLVAPHSEQRLPGFELARVIGQRNGWPVVLRSSGGTAFPIGPQTIQVSLVYRSRAVTEHSVTAAYVRLCEPFLQMLRSFGAECALHGKPSSMCDGAHNLCVRGRKLAGTAQRQRLLRDGTRVILSHLSLQACGAITRPMAALEQYYALAGAPRAFDAPAHTTLARCLGDIGQGGMVVAGPAFTRWIACVLARFLRPAPRPCPWSAPQALHGVLSRADIP